jgi:predicted RNA binding protein YcfA (HicA-like mRNA interferase family)
MAKHIKALMRLSATPPPSDIKWEALVGILQRLGYTQIKGSGSRRKFFHKEKNALIVCHAPHPSPEGDKGCIADVVEHLKTYEFI